MTAEEGLGAKEWKIKEESGKKCHFSFSTDYIKLLLCVGTIPGAELHWQINEHKSPFLPYWIEQLDHHGFLATFFLCPNFLLTSFTSYLSIFRFPRGEFNLFSSSFQTRAKVLLTGLVSGLAAFVSGVHPCSVLPQKVGRVIWYRYSHVCSAGVVMHTGVLAWISQKAEFHVRIYVTVFIKGDRSEYKKNWSSK